MIRLVYSFAHLSSKSEYRLALNFWSVLLLITTFCGRVPTYLQVVTKQKGVCDNQVAHDIKPSHSQGSTSFPLFFLTFWFPWKDRPPNICISSKPYILDSDGVWSIPFHFVSSCVIDELCMYVYHNLDLNILLFLWPPIVKFQFEKYLNIFLLLVGFGRLLSKWPNFTKTMEWNKTGAPFYNIIILHCTCWA